MLYASFGVVCDLIDNALHRQNNYNYHLNFSTFYRPDKFSNTKLIHWVSASKLEVPTEQSHSRECTRKLPVKNMSVKGVVIKKLDFLNSYFVY